MKKIIFLLIFLLAYTSLDCFSQIAKIIETEGQVKAKIENNLNWIEAKRNLYLEASAQIKTENNAHCIISFDEENNNIIAIRENTQLTINEIVPAKINLTKGRVFSIIENLTLLESFTIRTPTAVAGVRGTEELVAFDGNKTYIKCFKGELHIQALDDKGLKTAQRYLRQGYALEVDSKGVIANLKLIKAADYNEWNDFKESKISNLKEKITEKLDEIKKPTTKRNLVIREGLQLRKTTVAVEGYVIDGVFEIAVD